MTEALEYGDTTRRLLEETIKAGDVSRMLVIMRHSARHYDHENPINEPFMGLTEEGKAISHDWGAALPKGMTVGFYSSFIGRCIETAYLIDKGYVRQGGETRHNIIEKTLSPYYVRDAGRLFQDYMTEAAFFQQWFAEEIPESIIDHPGDIARELAGFCVERLVSGGPDTPGMDIGITHDWNLYVIRQYLLGVPFAQQGKVEYLDGVVVYQQGGYFYLMTDGCAPKELVPDR